jgi:hypothetical protein
MNSKENIDRERCSENEQKTERAERTLKIDLSALGRSLKQAFGETVSAEVASDLLRLEIGNKIAWINSSGELEGEARKPHSDVLGVIL